MKPDSCCSERRLAVCVNPTGRHDRLHFSHLPTPLEPMDRLGRYLGGPHLFIKRDDCTGLAAGGNSTRKLEFLMAEAISSGGDVIITQGPIQSNHARQTAAIASKLNMRCALALEDRADGDDRLYSGSANVLLDRLYGADIHRFPAGTDMESATRSLAGRYEALGKRPHVIPGGGSNPVGALGYVNCAFEIANQLREQGLRIDRVVHATVSGGTQAGLIVGFLLADIKIPVLGIGVGLPKLALEQKVYDLVRNLRASRARADSAAQRRDGGRRLCRRDPWHRHSGVARGRGDGGALRKHIAGSGLHRQSHGPPDRPHCRQTAVQAG